MAGRPEELGSAGTEPATGQQSVDRTDRTSLPLEARVDVAADHCIVRLPVRREEITVHRETFVAGVATIRRVQVSDAASVGGTVRSERLRVDVDGDVSVVREPDVASVREEREEAR